MNYYKKLFRTYIIITITFIVLISLIFSGGYGLVTQKEQDRSNEAVFSQICSYTNLHLSSLQEIMLLLSSSDTTLKYVAENPDTPNRYNRLELHKLISDMTTINQLDCYLMVTKLTDNYYLSNQSTGELKFGINKLPFSEDYFYEVINSFTSPYSTETRFVSVTSETEEKKFVVISRLWIRNYPLYVFAVYNQDDLFVIEYEQDYGFALLTENDVLLYLGALDQEQLTNQLASTTDSTNIHHNRTVLTEHFSFYGQQLTYAMLTETASILNPTFILIITSCIAALVLSILLMRWLTGRMYAPIQQTLEITDVLEEETTDEFILIRNNFLALKSKTEKLEHQLIQYYTPAQAKFIHDLLMGFISKEQFPEKCKKYKITDTQHDYVVVIMKVNMPQPINPEDAYSFLYSARSHILSAVETDNNLQLFQILDLTLTEQAYIFCDTDIRLLTNILHFAYNQLTNEQTADISIALGSVCNDLAEISKSFLHASHLISQTQYISSQTKVLVYNENEAISSTPYVVYYPLNMEQALINAVINNKHSVCQNLLKTIIDTNQQKNNSNLMHLALMLSATIDRILSTVNINTEAFTNNLAQIYRTLHSCKTYDALYKNTCEILNNLSEQLDIESDSQSLRTQMLEFIHTNYIKDISLLDLAEHLHMSNNYTSSLFKEVIGKNFKEYLGEYRVQKACDLITQKKGNIKLLDVADAVGCNSSSLLRLFTHYKGITPSEWIMQEFHNK